MDVFLTTYEHESGEFFREWTFMSYGHERNDFFVKIEIKRAFAIYFFGQLYSVGLTELTFFGPNMGMAAGGFS